MLLTGNTRVGDMSSTSTCSFRPLWLATAEAGTKAPLSEDIGFVVRAFAGVENGKATGASAPAFLATPEGAK